MVNTIDISTANLNRSSPIPLARQLYNDLHQKILQGDILSGVCLPPTRVLAKQLNVSRGVVVECYEMLKLDDLILGLGKGGTRVCYNTKPTHTSAKPHPCKPLEISKRGRSYANARNYKPQPSVPCPLTPGVPDFSLFPTARWTKLHRGASIEAPQWYTRQGGLLSLKKMIAQYLRQYRGISIENLDRLIITSSTQSTLSFLAQFLADPNDSALLEEPCWAGVTASINAAGLSIKTAYTDDEGANIPAALQSIISHNNKIPKLAIVTPSCQFPTGQAMSMARRESLIQSAIDHDFWVIEDDYAAEYSYQQHPPSSLLAHGDTASQRVIHLGTTSKLMFPGLRIGWMVVPESIAQSTTNALNTIGTQPSYILQQQLADFIQAGYLQQHLANTRIIYSQRKSVCCQYLEMHANEYLHVIQTISSMNILVKLNIHPRQEPALSKQLKQACLGVELYSITKAGDKNLYALIGSANLNTEQDTQLFLNSFIQTLEVI